MQLSTDPPGHVFPLLCLKLFLLGPFRLLSVFEFLEVLEGAEICFLLVLDFLEVLDAAEFCFLPVLDFLEVLWAELPPCCPDFNAGLFFLGLLLMNPWG